MRRLTARKMAPCLALMVVGLVLAAPAADAQVRYVDASAAGAGDGSSWADAFVELRDALAVTRGGALHVAEGTYTPAPAGGSETAPFVIPDGLRLYGGFPTGGAPLAQRDPAAHPTVLSGDIGADDVYGTGTWYVGWNINTPNSDHIVELSGCGPTTLVDGFTVQAAHAAFEFGAGMLVQGGAPTVRGCTFRRNLTGWGIGAGLFLWDADAVVEDCTFVENYVHLGSGAGLGVYGASAPVIRDCAFLSNLCVGESPEATGGGLENDSTLAFTVERCRFENNITRNFYAQGSSSMTYGGGLHHQGTAKLSVRDCLFRNNLSYAGGGLFSWRDLEVVDSVFVDNDAVSYNGPVGSLGDYGGGIGVWSFGTYATTITGCTFARNSAGEGGGLAVLGTNVTTVRNSVFWGNVATGEETKPLDKSLTGTKDIMWSCVEDLLTPIPGEDPPDPAKFPGCLVVDPLLMDAPAGDLHLAPASPCIDAGRNADVPPGDAVDVEGRPRLFDDPATPDTGAGTAPLVDMGAHEFGGPPSPWTLLGSGLPGAGGIPHLAGTGTLAAGSAGALTLTDAAPAASALVFVAFASVPTAFKGGVLLTVPVGLALPLATDVGGGLALPWLAWPAGVPTGASLWFQVAVQDAAGPQGASLSNGLRALTP